MICDPICPQYIIHSSSLNPANDNLRFKYTQYPKEHAQSQTIFVQNILYSVDCPHLIRIPNIGYYFRYITPTNFVQPIFGIKFLFLVECCSSQSKMRALGERDRRVHDKGFKKNISCCTHSHLNQYAQFWLPSLILTGYH